jgi:hypothetical protein
VMLTIWDGGSGLVISVKLNHHAWFGEVPFSCEGNRSSRSSLGCVSILLVPRIHDLEHPGDGVLLAFHDEEDGEMMEVGVDI